MQRVVARDVEDGGRKRCGGWWKLVGFSMWEQRLPSHSYPVEGYSTHWSQPPN